MHPTEQRGRGKEISGEPARIHPQGVVTRVPEGTWKLFDKLGVIVEVEISSEILVKLHKVYVWMPWHQEPMKDVAKLR